MNILLLSPYHGGSHRAWSEGYKRYSQEHVELLTMPARFWKWRMHGGAITVARRFLERFEDSESSWPDAIVATDMLDLTTFVALTRVHCASIPLVLYMHENQLTYPLPHDPSTGPMRRQRGERDLHYTFINLASMLAADRVVFNSQYHHDSLVEALPAYLKRFPEFNELGTLNSLREKSSVLPVGIDGPRLSAQRPPTDTGAKQDAPLILWNQRWEYDKDPASFFNALYKVQEEGISFRLALCGESFSQAPTEFEEATSRLQGCLVHVGYAPAEKYRELLWSADIVISTARHEFFGISIVEAVYCRTFPILPARLSYPELLPQEFHGHCLYESDDALVSHLRWALQNLDQTNALSRKLAPAMERFSWELLAPQYDAFFHTVLP
ncbi:MAG: tRNA-queuosine alpha-mannosyltransferase domain-containing protein [Chloroflexota bacterium]